MDHEADWDNDDLNAAKKPWEHTGLKTKPMDLQEACRLVDITVRPSIIDQMQAASSSRSKKNFKAFHKRSTKRRKTSTIPTGSDAFKASSRNMAVIDLESDLE